MTNQKSIPLAQSRSFFHPHLSLRAMAAAPGPPAPPAPEPAPTGGLITYILASEKVSPAAQKSLDDQKNYVISLAGVGNAYARKQANDKKDPNLVYNLDLWQQIYNNLPLMGPSQFVTQTYNETSAGIEIATKFIEVILGFAVSGGAALASFGKFLQGLGDNIKLGVTVKNQSYTTATIACVLRSQAAQPDAVEAYLQGYWIDFTAKQTDVYLACATVEALQITFNYKFAQSLFNVGALDNPTVKKDFEDFLSGTQIDDIKRSQKFFGGDFAKSTSVSRAA
jgi:Virulence factor Evf